MLTSIVALALLAPAQANADTCRKVREVEALAVREGYTDVPAFRALGARYCPRPPTVERNDCWDLWLLTELAWTNGASDAAREADQLRAVTCAAGGLGKAPRWTTGVAVVTPEGLLRYPNGVTARSSNGVWRYPNGVQARSELGAFSYPNGVRAMSEQGRWSDPWGRSYRDVTEMLMTSCGPGACVHELDQIRDWEGQARIVGIIRIAWEASQKRGAKR